MPIDKIQCVTFLALCLCASLPRIKAGGEHDRALLHGSDDGTLLFEAATDQNITFRLMGEAATLLLNDVDIVAVLERRRRAQASAVRWEPLSLDALKEQFRNVQRDLMRLGRWLTKTQNRTRRAGPTQRVLRRDIQRVQTIANTLTTLESNLLKNDCESNPCKNGGTCYDAYNGFYCTCADGWQGATCEDDVNECFRFAGTDSAVCQNDAQCINTPGSYRCVCRNGFSGAHCRLRQHVCLSNQSAELCGSHGTCLPANSAAGYVCICEPGWTWADTNVSSASASPCTRDVNECAPDVNPCHDECINLPGSFRCGACPPGYTGDGRHCRDLNECEDGNNGGCSQRPLVNCINTEGSYRCGRCPPGWTGDGRVCSEAKSNSCNGESICHPRAECEYISGTVVCSCPAGFFGHGYGADGCTEDSSRRPCDDHRCLNNGTCVLSGRGTSCICQPGYTGALCAEADACHPNPCQNNGVCHLLPGNKHQCVCPAGFTGSSCSHVRSYCGIVLREEAGSLQFPPSSSGSSSAAGTGYQPNERCAFIIRTRPGLVLNVTFGLFDLQQTPADCSADFLQLHDGSSLTARQIGRFCGTRLPLGDGRVVTTQEQLFLWFRSDNETQARGFNLTWHSQPFTCGETLQLALGDSGVLRSPSYPGKARSGLDCRWLLRAPYGNRLILRFYEITLGNGRDNGEWTTNCSNGDSLGVWESDRLLHMACQSEQPAPLHSSSNQLRIVFHTDRNRADSLFQLHYEVVPGHPGCGGIFNEPSGVVSGYMNAKLCLYLIEQPYGTQIELTFLRVKLLHDCSLQQLEIFDGRTDEEPLLRRYCGEPEDSELLPVTSKSNVILLRYEYALAGLELTKSFELRYKRVCRGVYFDADVAGGVIATPNYPNSYLEQLDCTYHIRGQTGYLLRLNITDLSLSETQDEDQFSYLDVYLSRNESAKQRFVKNLTNLLIVSENNQARLVFHGASNPQRARGLRMLYSFIPTECGGVMIREVPGTYRGGDYCQWIIEEPGQKHLRIVLRSYLSQIVNVHIYDNSTGSEGRLLNSYNLQVSNVQNIDEYFDSNLVTVSAAGVASGLYFVYIRYEMASQACGINSTARFGIIQSPNWPLKYASNSNCTWLIKAPLGQRIELMVHNFTLETTAERCADDYLEIRNGDQSTSPLIGLYCGNRIPPRIPSFGNALWVRFRSDSIVEEAGFRITWQQMATGCGGKLNSPTGAIHSPHSIEGNRGALACDWQITVAQGSTVQLTLQSRDPGLCNGQLAIFDGPNIRSKPMAWNCSSEGQRLLLSSSSNHVLVRYNVEKESPEGVDFVLDYSTNCRVRLEELQGAIETPNFPDKYPANANCEWDIRAGARSNHIQLAFSHLAVEQLGPNSCDFDYVLLGDYRDEQLISERRLCHAKDLDFTSVGNRVLLRFSSDNSMEAQGFRAEYKRLGCGDVLQGTAGSFETPNAPYSVDVDCEWVITVPEGNQIRLLLTEVHIETSQRDCSEDKLSVLSGSDSSVPLYSTCHVESAVQTLISPANEMRVRFHSGPQRTRKYVEASYVMFQAACGGYVSASNGIITSPGFNEPGYDIYDKDLECVWSIEVADSYGFLLMFDSFNLTGSPDCRVSSLELSHFRVDNRSEQLIKRVCGETFPSIKLVQNHLRLRLRVTEGFWARFSMRFEQVCGGTRTDSEGYLRSRLDEICYWNIAAPEGTKVTLNIHQLECQRCAASAGNCTSGLRVLNALDEVVYYDLCEEHPMQLLLPTNSLMIQTSGVALVAYYSTVENSCGGNITSVRGTLTSPGYPNSYPANVECVWQLETREGNAMELRFEAMDIVQSEHCNTDFLELRAGLQGPLIGLYCDNELPAEPLLVNSTLWIKFRSQAASTASGFKLRWSYVHDNELTEGTNGTIESPSKVSIQGDDQPYSWRIIADRERVVILSFREYNTGLLLFDGYDDTALPVTIASSPWQFTSSSNVIYLKTVNKDFDHFRVQWRVLRSEEVKTNMTLKSEVCNRVYTLDNGMVRLNSPGYPGYKPNLNCEWTFVPKDPSKHAYVDIFEARLEVTIECQLDYLSVQTSSNMIDWPEQLRICNSSAYNGKRISRVHGTPNLRLQFVTDATINGTGFRSIVNTECGSNMTGPVGTILNSYTQRLQSSNEVGCEWHIEVRRGRVIEITIEYNETARNTSCSHYGIIYDGLDAYAPQLAPGKFCNQLGYNTVRSYRTSGPHAYVRYVYPSTKLNFQPVQSSWNLTYREFSECDAEVRLTHLASSYNISSPGYPYYPHPHSDCTWVVVAPPGETIAATFVDRFALSQRNCDKEFVELYDGSTTLARRLLRTCRSTGTKYSSGNLLLVHYQTQLNEPHGGFRLNVSLSRCGGRFTARSGTIQSEHYPALGGYPKPAVCEYSILSMANTHIQLNFTDLHLPFAASSDSEGLDRIEILDPNDERKIVMTLFGNRSAPIPITLTTNQVVLRFVTKQLGNKYRGFKLEYQSLFGSCHQTVNAASGELELKKSEPTQYIRFCSWRITVPKGQRVRLELLNLDEFRSLNSTPRMMFRTPVSFYNDPIYLSKITALNPQNYNGDGVVRSTDNFMLVRMVISAQPITLRARFSSSEASPCPDDIGSRASGTISNEGLEHLPTYYCTINFVSDPGVTTSFTVQEYRSRRQQPSVQLNDDVVFNKMSLITENATYSLATTAGHLTLMKQMDNGGTHFRATYRRYACGGHVELAEGTVIELPQMVAHFGQLECAWTLMKPFGYEINGDLSLSDNCDREYLMISDQKFCGSASNLNTTMLNSLQIRLLYHATEYRADSTPFRLQTSKPESLGGWGNIIIVGRQPTPPIKIDAQSYRNNMELSWEFQALGKLSLQLQFQGRFFIETAPNCSHDSLEVLQFQQGMWQPLAKYCGREMPDPLFIPASSMRVVFRTDDQITADGFTFVVSPSCDTKLVASTELQTLSFLKLNRLAGRECSIEITTDTKHQLLVSVTSRSRARPSAQLCRLVGFMAYRLDGEHEEEQSLGRQCPTFEVTGYKRIRIVYTPQLMTSIAWELQYQRLECGGDYRAPFTLRPPIGIANGKSCEWHVMAPPQHAILMRFKYLDIESSQLCQLGHLSIYRGNAVNEEHRLYRLCGNLTRPSIMVDSNQATIVYKLYLEQSSRGFLASVHFTPNCNERLALSEGNTRMSLVRHYQLNATNGTEDLQCFFRASAAPGYRLSVWLKQLQLNANRCKGESCNTLEVIDGFDRDSTSMGIYSAVDGNDTKLFSSNPDLLIKLSGTVAQPNGIGFELILQMEATVCGQLKYNLLGNEVMNIRMSNVNQTSLGGSIHCMWGFKANAPFELDLKSVQLQDVAQSTGKCIDYLLMSIQNGDNRYFCGQFRNTVVDITNGTQFTLTFHSSRQGVLDSIDISLHRKANCNRTYNALSGMIYYYTNNELEIGNCTNYIRVPDKYYLTLEIMYITLEHGSNTSSFNVTDLRTNHVIYNLTNNEYISFVSVRSTANAIRLSGLGVRFLQLTYYSTTSKSPPGCGGELNGLEGIISNPDYDNRNYSDCSWRISVPGGKTLQFSFRSFDMGSHSNCQLDNIKVYEVLPDFSEKLHYTFCGQEEPEVFLVKFNQIRIAAKKSPNFNGIGFQLYFYNMVE
ncbi:PREDICTED: cubilin homolog [Drosophila arizonae]|uniref:Cubilin homolog n=1 Tax=Drosophila arizonae TaxID=7263 RepID=A0ABM1P8M7_DROAR|nr:PREDICTED: cubilin homolog [Drosophila arizonae]